MEFLAAGGSASPGELLAKLGVDLTSAEIWDSAFAELERMVAAAESEVAAEA
jgi:oligoendopeptidase F